MNTAELEMKARLAAQWAQQQYEAAKQAASPIMNQAGQAASGMLGPQGGVGNFAQTPQPTQIPPQSQFQEPGARTNYGGTMQQPGSAIGQNMDPASAQRAQALAPPPVQGLPPAIQRGYPAESGARMQMLNQQRDMIPPQEQGIGPGVMLDDWELAEIERMMAATKKQDQRDPNSYEEAVDQYFATPQRKMSESDKMKAADPRSRTKAEKQKSWERGVRYANSMDDLINSTNQLHGVQPNIIPDPYKDPFE